MPKTIRHFIDDFINYNQKKNWDQKAFGMIGNSDLILDAGCGLGRFMELAPEKIIGIDSNPDTVRVVKEKGFKIFESKTTDLPFPDEKFDAIFCSHVIEHLASCELHKTLEEFDRVLKNNGTLIITSPLMWKHFYSDLTHIRPYNPEVIISYMTGGLQRSKKVISTDYRVINIFWRHISLPRLLSNSAHCRGFKKLLKNVLRLADGILYHTGFNVFLKKNGYMLILKKCSK